MTPSGALVVGDRIGRLALVQWPEGEPPPRLDELAPPTVGGAAILLVRRVAVMTDPETARQAVGAELATAADTAARPARGYVDPGAEAVCFTDAAELVACYLLSLRRAGVVPGWVWDQLAGSLPPPSLAAVLRDPATPVVAVIAALQGWSRLEVVVGDLDPDTERQVVEAVAVRHDLWVRTCADGAATVPPPAIAAYPPGPGSEADAGRPSTWEVGRRGAARALCRVTSGASFAVSLSGLARVLLGGAGPAASLPAAPEDDGTPAALGADAVPTGPATPTTTAEAFEGDHGRPAPPDGGRLPVTRDPGRRQAAPRGRGPDGGPGGRPASLVPRLVHDDAAATVGRPAGHGADRGTPPDTSEAGVATDVGGVLYLVNRYRCLDLAAAGLADAAPWDVVDGLGRAALAAVDALDESDSLWKVLAGLAGRSPGERPAPAVLAACRRALVAILADLDLGPDEPELGELLLVSGRLHVGPTRVDLVAPLEAVHLSVRRRALDADPGWVPACGRVVRFHFGARGSS